LLYSFAVSSIVLRIVLAYCLGVLFPPLQFFIVRGTIWHYQLWHFHLFLHVIMYTDMFILFSK
jgi:hypothetical protein